MARFLLCLSLALTLGSASTVFADEATVDVDGYVQAVGVVMDESSEDEVDPDSGRPLNDTRFLVRRARLGVGSQWGPAFGRLVLDGSVDRGARARLLGAYAGVRTEGAEGAWPWVQVRMGSFRTPFGRDLQQVAKGRLFLERTLASDALVPGTYDLGVEARGQWRFLRYQLALMNGAPIGAEYGGQDPIAAKDGVARLAVATPITTGVRIDTGVSLLLGRGFSPGTASTKDSVQWRDANENGVVEISELVPVAGSSARASSTFRHTAIGADLEVGVDIPVLGELELFGEAVLATNLDRGELVADPVVLGRDLREFGWNAGLTQELFGRGVVGVRYDFYDPDADANERIAADIVPRDRTVSSLSVVLGWTSLSPFALFVEYDHNDNHYGRSASGEPTRLADDRLLVRAEVGL